MQETAELYFSGPIPEGSAYLGENIRKNYRVIQRAAAEWGANWMAEKAGIKKHNPAPEDPFLLWLDEQIENLARVASNERGNEYHRFDGKRVAMIQVKEKYISLKQQ